MCRGGERKKEKATEVNLLCAQWRSAVPAHQWCLLAGHAHMSLPLLVSWSTFWKRELLLHRHCCGSPCDKIPFSSIGSVFVFGLFVCVLFLAVCVLVWWFQILKHALQYPKSKKTKTWVVRGTISSTFSSIPEQQWNICAVWSKFNLGLPMATSLPITVKAKN